jgi:hypothetical protein
MDPFGSAQGLVVGALVNTVMNLRVLAPHSYRNGNAHHIGMGSLVHSGIIAVKREEFVSDRCHMQ